MLSWSRTAAYDLAPMNVAAITPLEFGEREDWTVERPRQD